METPPKVLIDRNEVLSLFPVKRTTLRKLIRTAGFPAPVKFGRVTLWRRREVMEWLETR